MLPRIQSACPPGKEPAGFCRGVKYGELTPKSCNRVTLPALDKQAMIHRVLYRWNGRATSITYFILNSIQNQIRTDSQVQPTVDASFSQDQRAMVPAAPVKRGSRCQASEDFNECQVVEACNPCNTRYSRAYLFCPQIRVEAFLFASPHLEILPSKPPFAPGSNTRAEVVNLRVEMVTIGYRKNASCFGKRAI